MSAGQRIDRSGWPSDRPRRTFFELLDGVHREHGAKSLRAVADEMNLAANSRVSALLLGALPSDERQAGELIRALGGSAGDIERGLMLYRAIRPSGAGEAAAAQRRRSVARDPGYAAMPPAAGLSGGFSVPDSLKPYLQRLTNEGGVAPQSAVQGFVEPRVRARADGTTSGALEILRDESPGSRPQRRRSAAGIVM